MSKLGRHQRTIRLPDEEPWNIPPEQPSRERGQPRPVPVTAPEPEHEPVPSRR